jgi:hypothetical protein
MSSRGQLYHRILDVTFDYLGPAAPRFVDRQIEYHLHKLPQNITLADLDTFIEWAQAALAMLTEDETIRSEYVERLRALLPKKLKPTRRQT